MQSRQSRNLKGRVDMRGRSGACYGLLVWVGLPPSLGGCASAAETEFIDGSRPCELTRQMYCLLDEELSVEIERPTRDSGGVVTMYGESWRKNPAAFIEPSQCQASVSDAAEILEYVEDYRWHGQLWDRMVVRLHSGEQCDLQLLFPGGERDPGRSALWTLLSQLRICQTGQCSDPRLNEAIGEDLRKRGHYPVSF